MPLPTIESRPTKEINGFQSNWNAANLPVIYGVSNTKFPINTEDTAETVLSIADNNGYAQLTLSASTSLVAKEWVTIDAGDYEGNYQIRSIESTTEITINTEFLSDETGTIVKYYNSYTNLAKVFVLGSEVGTIQQIPVDNTSLVDVSKYVKSSMSSFFDKDKLGQTYNDINAYSYFYIEYAESYNIVVDGAVELFESDYVSDASNLLNASFSSLQFGNECGGNMYRYIADILKSDLGEFMTDLEEGKVINYDDYNLSIILDDSVGITAEVNAYDQNNLLLDSGTFNVPDEGVGLYRIKPVYGFIDDVNTDHITIQLFNGATEISEVYKINIDNKCVKLYNWIDSDGACVVDENDEPIITL